jgi:gamma-glutamylcyclotransferase (GGCT)/AIG2-like uncharacterized protein YtfP
MPDTTPDSTPEESPPARHVFVYGTLRRGDDNDITRLLPAPQYVGESVIVGVMYHLGAYPGVILGKPAAGEGGEGGEGGADGLDGREGREGREGRIIGEVYAIEPALEARLDEIEMIYPQQRDEYFKRDIRVAVGGKQLDCIVYEINPTYVTNRPVIGSGDWVKDR